MGWKGTGGSYVADLGCYAIYTAQTFGVTKYNYTNDVRQSNPLGD